MQLDDQRPTVDIFMHPDGFLVDEDGRRLGNVAHVDMTIEPYGASARVEFRFMKIQAVDYVATTRVDIAEAVEDLQKIEDDLAGR